MSTEPPPDGPDQDEMIALVRDRWPDAAIFFSLDEKHWPTFATIVWQDDFDDELLPLIGAAHDRLVAQRERLAANLQRRTG